MIFCLFGIGFKRFKSGMPVAGSCSLAIAAACHLNPDSLEGEQKDAEFVSEMGSGASRW